MQINIEPEKCWDAPEGIHTATLDQFREITDKRTNKKLVRVTFQLDEYSTSFKMMMVAKNFEPSLSPGSELRRFLVDWVGQDFLELHAPAGQFDPKILESKRAKLHIVHVHNKSHERPFVVIRGIEPCHGQVSVNEYAGDGI
jgi:hypothetical protein